MVVDLDGDGLEDLLFNDGGLKYFKNSANGFGAATSLTRETNGTVHGMTPDIGSLAKGIKSASIVDVNGDGKTDIFLKIKTKFISEEENDECLATGGTEVFGPSSWQLNGGPDCNTPTVRYSYTWNAYTLNGNKLVNIDFNLNSSPSGELRSADFNGDGLSDVAYRDFDTWYYRLSTGKNFTNPKALTVMGTSNNSEDFARHRFMDINKDGRTDIARYLTTGSYKYYLSSPAANPEIVNFTARGSQNFGKNSIIHFVDIEGDGKLDVLSATSNSSGWKLFRSMRPGRLDNVIEKFKNGFGPETTVEYAPLYNSSVLISDVSSNKLDNDYINLKAGIYVVANVETESNLEPATTTTTVEDFFDSKSKTWREFPITRTVKDNTVKVSYKYGGALAHKKGRGYLGFETLQTKDHQTGVITDSQYHQLFPLTGMPKATTVSYKGTVLKASHNSYAATSKSIRGGYHPYLKKSQEIMRTVSFDEGNTPTFNLQKLTTNASTYDSWNNLRLSTVTTGKPSAFSFTASLSDKSTTVTDNKYEEAGMSAQDSLRFGRLSSTQVTKVRDASKTRHGTAGTSRKSSFTYNTEGLLKTSTVNGLVTTYVYDDRGNKKQITKSGLVDGAKVQERTSSMNYGTKGRYVLSQTDGLGNTETFLYNGLSGDEVTGRIWSITQTGPNKIASTSYFGWQGEKVQTLAADGNEVISAMSYCNNGCDGDGFYYTTVTKTGSPTATTYFNRLGQKIKTQTQGFDGTLVQVLHEYDKQGRAHKVSQSHYVGETAYYTQQFYDPLGTVYKTLMPDPRYSDLYTTQYSNGFTKTITNTKGITFTENYSADGLLVKKTTPSFVTNGVTTPKQTIDYSYDHYGNLTKAVTKVGSKTLTLTNEFNQWGQKEVTNDPDKGRWSYKYNAFGELYSQTTAKGDETTMFFDTLGRMIRRTQPEGSTCWAYGNSATDKNVGKLVTVKQWNNPQACNSAALPQYVQQMTYDSYGRPSTTTTNNKGEVFTSSVKYDSLGRVKETVYPKGVHSFSVEQSYNSLGYLTHQRNGRTGKLLREIKKMNAFGRVTEDTVGNGVTTTRDFYHQNGRISRIAAKGTFQIHDLNYREYDRAGNLVSRDSTYKSHWSGGYTFNESFSYDAIDRLIKRDLAANTSPNSEINGDFNYVYDGFGNFKTKSNVGTYHYTDASRANRLKSISGSTNYSFIYDDNGNVTNDGIRTHEYTSFDKAHTISKGQVYTKYDFGPSREVIYREDYLQEKNDLGTLAWMTKQTHYAGKSYQKERIVESGRSDKVKHTYFAGGIMVVQHESTGIEQTNYLHGDYQGSTISMTDDKGNLLQQYYYTPFGEQKTAFTGGLNRLLSVMPVGYTGHEMVNHLNIIQMGGRTYDAKIGRFLQADIAVQTPDNVQAYNKYSYVLNNPYTYTDPSGYFFKKLYKKFLKVTGLYALHKFLIKNPILNAIAQIVVSYYGGPWATAGFSFDQSFVATGSLRQAFKSGALSYAASAAFSQIGDSFQGTGVWANGGAGHITAHALTGGVISELQGGNFGHGFFSAGFTKFATSNVGFDYSDRSADAVIGRTIIAATIGGTSSVISGGKFGNGAMTAAIAHLYNAESRVGYRNKYTGKLETPGWNAVPATDSNGEYIYYEEKIVFQSVEGKRTEKFLGKQRANLAMCTQMQECVDKKLNNISVSATSTSKPHIKLGPSGVTFLQKWILSSYGTFGKNRLSAAVGVMDFYGAHLQCATDEIIVYQCSGGGQ